MYVCACVSLCRPPFLFVCARARVCVYVCMYVYTYVFMHACMLLAVCVCACVRACVCLYASTACPLPLQAWGQDRLFAQHLLFP